MQEPLNLANSPIPLQQILLPIYTYKIKNYTEFEPIITTENVNIGQFNVNLYVDLNTKEGALKWLNEFQEISKTTMLLKSIILLKNKVTCTF